MSVRQAAEKWDISERRVRILCSEGRIDGVVRSGWAWNIPDVSPKPGDGRQLRHLKHLDLRFGAMDFSRLEKWQLELAQYAGDENEFLDLYKDIVLHILVSSFSFGELSFSKEDFSQLFSGRLVFEKELPVQLLALNCRAIFLRFIQQTGLGPLKGQRREGAMFHEQSLASLYKTMMQGIDDELTGAYREALILPGNPPPNDMRVFSVSVQMETLVTQYENEWSHFHPLVRGLFLFGELLRIRPFGRYDEIFATLVLGGELLAGGYPPAFVEISHLDEFRAALLLTRTHGNYQNAVRMLEQSLLYEFSQLAKKESDNGL
ncbi:hypothetical protein [uncultured Sphaerochaeta sp.]|uniref:hypothetical protein n=1 Tax=uncultured Sphaerochaeta sp. TaxID=886478 RepID=UPI002A0A4A74|nr:hypothetical protein [uncultured Sphaerochaeta sp.]